MQETTTEIRFAPPGKYIEESVIYKKKLLHVGFLSGNEACAYGALWAGLGFYAGYPITPSTEIAEILSGRMPVRGRTFVQMEDEIASMGAIIGASLAGKKSMTATSGPGFSLMQENLGYACMAEVPCVVVNVQRGGPSTGSPTSPAQADLMQARWGTHGDHPIIVLYPTSVQEAFDLTIQAFNLAEKFRTPVVFLMDEVIGHMREKVLIPDEEDVIRYERRKPESGLEDYEPYGNADLVPPMAAFGEGYRFHVTGLHHDPHGFPTLRKDEINAWWERVYAKIERNLDEILLYREEGTEGEMDTLLISCGISARSAVAAAREARARGQRVGVLTLHTLWPFPEEVVRERASRARGVIVPELNRGQLRGEVERATRRLDVDILGINRLDGTVIPPSQILEKIEVAPWHAHSR